MNACAPPDMCIGLAHPLPWAPTIVLMDIVVFYVGPCVLYLEPARIQYIPGEMSYLNGEDVSDPIVMHPSSGDHAEPVAWLSDVVAVETGTWGGLKSLYH